MPGPNDLLSVAEVATMKGVQQDTVRRRIQRDRTAAIKKLPAVKKSDVWLIRRKDAEAWTPRGKGGEE